MRLIALCVLLAVAAVPAAGATHAARMGAAPSHAAHVSQMMQASDAGAPACGGDQDCGSMDAGTCALICAGLTAPPPSPAAQTGAAQAPARHEAAPPGVLSGAAPELSERPPKHGLL